jgi:hypothetical protein
MQETNQLALLLSNALHRKTKADGVIKKVSRAVETFKLFPDQE